VFCRAQKQLVQTTQARRAGGSKHSTFRSRAAASRSRTLGICCHKAVARALHIAASSFSTAVVQHLAMPQRQLETAGALARLAERSAALYQWRFSGDSLVGHSAPSGANTDLWIKHRRPNCAPAFYQKCVSCIGKLHARPASRTPWDAAGVCAFERPSNGWTADPGFLPQLHGNACGLFCRVLWLCWCSLQQRSFSSLWKWYLKALPTDWTSCRLQGGVGWL